MRCAIGGFFRRPHSRLYNISNIVAPLSHVYIARYRFRRSAFMAATVAAEANRCRVNNMEMHWHYALTAYRQHSSTSIYMYMYVVFRTVALAVIRFFRKWCTLYCSFYFYFRIATSYHLKTPSESMCLQIGTTLLTDKFFLSLVCPNCLCVTRRRPQPRKHSNATYNTIKYTPLKEKRARATRQQAC